MSLFLHPLSPDHRESLLPLAADPAISAASSVGRPTLETWWGLLMADQRAAVPAARHFTVLAGEEMVGMTSLKKLDRIPGVGELSFWIGLPWQGRGLAVPAARETVEHGFGRLVLSLIEAHALRAGNPASTAVLRRLGFVRAGRDDEPVTGSFAAGFPGDAWRFWELPRRT